MAVSKMDKVSKKMDNIPALRIAIRSFSIHHKILKSLQKE
jgi:hypothetical protein